MPNFRSFEDDGGITVEIQDPDGAQWEPYVGFEREDIDKVVDVLKNPTYTVKQ
jgi:hypothetical protein